MSRTTLDIDDDVLAAVKDLAKAEGKTAGAVISELARLALTSPSLGEAGFAERQAAYANDLWITLPGRSGALVTPEDVRRVQEEIDREDSLDASGGGSGPILK